MEGMPSTIDVEKFAEVSKYFGVFQASTHRPYILSLGHSK